MKINILVIETLSQIKLYQSNKKLHFKAHRGLIKNRVELVDDVGSFLSFYIVQKLNNTTLFFKNV